MKTEVICKQPIIFTVDNFLTLNECNAYIAESEKNGYDEAPITTSQGFVMRKDIRNNLRVMVNDTTLTAQLFERATPFLPARFGQWDLLGLNERLRYYRYDVGQTFRPHYDASFDRSQNEASFLTFMLYLNDNFRGGRTAFYYNNTKQRVSVGPKQGRALVFEHQQLHEGAPVVSGRKYVLRTDVMYRLPNDGG